MSRPEIKTAQDLLKTDRETGIKVLAKYEDFADLRFIRELDETGFIDRLYPGKAAAR